MTEGWRTPQQREMDGILYSSAWRRLRGVTQVMPITGGVSKSHDRLTHSLKVAQVGMRFAQYLRFTDAANSEMIIPEAVYVAGMAHDLGHPPFGHIAENELQRILTHKDYKWRLEDSFEGNAQSFRILTRLAKKRSEPPGGGLGLSAESLAACTKYPWAYGQAKAVLGEDAYNKNPNYFDRKWGYYDSDQKAWQRVLDANLYAGSVYSPNAKLMDIADDVTFAIHDILDYFRRHLSQRISTRPSEIKWLRKSGSAIWSIPVPDIQIRTRSVAHCTILKQKRSALFSNRSRSFEEYRRFLMRSGWRWST